MTDGLTDHLSDDDIVAILQGTRRIAVLGASNKPERPSHGVMRFLLARGYDVTPVNPGLAGQDILGRQVVATLAEAGPLDMVDVFRRGEDIAAPLAEAAALGARTIWLQLGVTNPAAEDAARAAGRRVVVNRCPAIEMPRLGI